MQKRTLLLASFLIITLSLFAKKVDDFTKKLQKISAINHIEKVEKNDTTRTYYYVKFSQLLDTKQPDAGSFNQRILVGHKGIDRPTIIITEGYGGGSVFSNKHFYEELTWLLDANVIFVEHRYFNESTPQPCNWEYLTVANSMEDYHAITTAMKSIYKGKWLSTGISKGGSTSMFYRAYYPDDVDVSVPYVAPLSYALEDGRHETFIEQASTADKRDVVRNFQTMLFERKGQLMPMFNDFCKSKEFTFQVPTSTIYDYCILEYSFSFWQWGSSVESVPSKEDSDSSVFSYFMEKCGPDYFTSQSSLKSFFVQAVKDFGYYGYNTEPFKKYMSESAEGYLKKIMLGPEWQDVEFDGSNYRKVVDYLTQNDPKMIFIYGQWDPWTASGVTWLNDRNKKNIKIYIQPEGSHSARIGSMSPEVQQEILNQLNEWVDYRK